MTGRDKTGSAPKDDSKTKTPPLPKADDDEYEDGDMATPKQDRHGNDDEPLD